MKQFFGMSQSGRLEEALRGLKNPQFLMLLSNDRQFEEHVKALEKHYPGVPSIGRSSPFLLQTTVTHGCFLVV